MMDTKIVCEIGDFIGEILIWSHEDRTWDEVETAMFKHKLYPAGYMTCVTKKDKNIEGYYWLSAAIHDILHEGGLDRLYLTESE